MFFPKHTFHGIAEFHSSLLQGQTVAMMNHGIAQSRWKLWLFTFHGIAEFHSPLLQEYSITYRYHFTCTPQPFIPGADICYSRVSRKTWNRSITIKSVTKCYSRFRKRAQRYSFHGVAGFHSSLFQKQIAVMSNHGVAQSRCKFQLSTLHDIHLSLSLSQHHP